MNEEEIDGMNPFLRKSVSFVQQPSAHKLSFKMSQIEAGIK